jgi:hypothetical protein
VTAIGQTALASVAGGVAAYAVLRGCIGLFGPARGGSLAGVLAGSILGLLVMAVAAWLIGVPEARQLRARLASRGQPPSHSAP